MATNDKKHSAKKKSDGLSRRDFFKIGAASAAVGAAGVAAVPQKAAAKKLDENIKKKIVNEQDDFPNEVSADYKPNPSYQTAHGHAFFGRQLMAMGVDVDQELLKQGDSFVHDNNYHYEPGKKGWDQKAKAVMAGAWALSATGSGPMPGAIGDFGLLSWDNNTDKPPLSLMDLNYVQKEKCKFESKAEAAAVIKRAARLYGADLVGITRRDPRWDYSENFNYVPPLARRITPLGPEQMQNLMEVGGENIKNAMESWTPDKWIHDIDETAGFSPKTVIVIATEMDYEAISCSTNEISSGVVGEGYSLMTKIAHQVAVMIRGLGYKAIPCGNDTGMSVPYAIAAGLGEGARNSQLVTYKYGPRVRLCKVYTDFDFVEYDKPKTFGVEEFCKSCKRCADACPSDAIPFDKEPTFAPTHEHKDNPWFNAVGTKKWYLDAKKCFKQWADAKVDCVNCIASCPYNKPDFWHHRLVDSITAAMPGPVHTFMREMDIVFGYGNVDDEKAVDKFFDPKGKNYDGFES